MLVVAALPDWQFTEEMNYWARENAAIGGATWRHRGEPGVLGRPEHGTRCPRRGALLSFRPRTTPPLWPEQFDPAELTIP